MDTNNLQPSTDTNLQNPNNLQAQFDKLVKDLKDLNDEVYNNNFSSSQDFNKYSRFNTRLKIPHYSALPTVCETGEILEVGGKAYICSAPNTFTIIGTQS